MDKKIEISEEIKDADLIELLFWSISMYDSNEPGAEKFHAQQILGAAVDRGVKRPEVVRHFRDIVKNRTEFREGELRNAKRLFFLLSEAPPPQQTDSPGCLLALFSRQKKKAKRWGRGEGKKTLNSGGTNE